ncbi:MAG: hypothetical protein US42_C0008G0107 [Candidatus Magasanikbacteria bacterium GW2011_GWC2_37_14]|uniref:Uncharacterized protein n=1 Tax=Candidatus Magasanikbacteria bacterium GW2011_GWC2_37_14 TaxID=1619046 RepID=A0A0G0ITY0_9BACT|nr:MAG: hypothetical protein US42_C0008G0107 [Candidatus Magasanikbacteria bacterium GW2011_GWC2_37_14]
MVKAIFYHLGGASSLDYCDFYPLLTKPLKCAIILRYLRK